MTLRVRDHVFISSTNKTSSNYGFITKINDDDTIEVKVTIKTTIRKFKKIMSMLSQLRIILRDITLEGFLHHSEWRAVTRQDWLQWLRLSTSN